jgi:hypothetical protein
VGRRGRTAWLIFTLTVIDWVRRRPNFVPASGPATLARTPPAVRDGGGPYDVKLDKLSIDRRNEVTVDRFSRAPETVSVAQSELWESGRDDVCHVTPTHISSEDPSPKVTKWGGALRRIGNSCASLGS